MLTALERKKLIEKRQGKGVVNTLPAKPPTEETEDAPALEAGPTRRNKAKRSSEE